MHKRSRASTSASPSGSVDPEAEGDDGKTKQRRLEDHDRDQGQDQDQELGKQDKQQQQPAKARPAKKKRTRTGCLNCRRKKRKCDERRPACGGCGRAKEACEWGLRISWRRENCHVLDGEHPSMRKMARRRRPRGFEILDVTSEVIRDCNAPTSPQLDSESDAEPADLRARDDVRASSSVDAAGSHVRISSVGGDGCFFGPTPPLDDESSSLTQSQTENAVAHLLYVGQGGQAAAPTPSRGQVGSAAVHVSLDALPMDMDMLPEYSYNPTVFTPEGLSDDGIFLPGSAYQELHATLRQHLIQETRSNCPTRPTTPLPKDDGQSAHTSAVSIDEADDTLRLPELQHTASIELSKAEELVLWKNYIDEIAPWLDKFDRDRFFQQTLPTMAPSNEYLRYSMLALSARQLELKKTLPTDRSLALYQEAIHLLLPHLPTRDTAVIATCVILCVLEMLSCSPKAWQRHLDGCASLMEAVGINGFVGGAEQALFWCFARMDVCGGLMSSVKTLIPVSHWAAKEATLEQGVAMFQAADCFEQWANYAVFLLAHVLDLLAPETDTMTTTTTLKATGGDSAKFRARWLQLWAYICDWDANKPPQLQPLMTIPSSDASPFPTIHFSNPAAISGNQMHHTASILMLQNQPAGVRLTPKPRSILWHARRVCGISISNDHHGAWTNGIQPLWIAGRCMSHSSEHKAIINLLGRIERESGWSTRWRADDLRDFWGDLGD